MHPSWRILRWRQGLEPTTAATIGPNGSSALHDARDLHRQLVIEPTPASVGVARALIRSHVGAATPEQAETAAICGSELVANAVVHGAPPILLTVVSGGAQVVVAVEDGSRTPPAPRQPGPTEPGGRGTLIVERLADRWGVDFLPGGKRVWCLFLVQPP